MSIFLNPVSFETINTNQKNIKKGLGGNVVVIITTKGDLTPGIDKVCLLPVSSELCSSAI